MTKLLVSKPPCVWEKVEASLWIRIGIFNVESFFSFPFVSNSCLRVNVSWRIATIMIYPFNLMIGSKSFHQACFTSFQECQLCSKCLSDKQRMSLRISLIEHIHRLGMRRVYPKSMVRHDLIFKKKKKKRRWRWTKERKNKRKNIMYGYREHSHSHVSNQFLKKCDIY